MAESQSETAVRILSELEEAGEEELVTLINTVMPRTGEPSELDEFSSAVRDLISSGAITTERKGISQSFEPSSIMHESQSKLSVVAFDPVDGYWIDTTEAYDVYAIASPAGLERARRILDERGYKWWTQGT